MNKLNKLDILDGLEAKNKRIFLKLKLKLKNIFSLVIFKINHPKHPKHPYNPIHPILYKN